MANNDLLVLNELTESGGSLRPSIQVERALAEIKDTFQNIPAGKDSFHGDRGTWRLVRRCCRDYCYSGSRGTLSLRIS